MLQDSFIESLTVRKNGAKGIVFIVSSILLCLVLIVLIMFIPFLFWGAAVWPITSFISVALAFGLYKLLKRQHKEYELEISNDFFECAVISGKDKRDELVSFSIKDCEYIGPVTSDRFSSDRSKANFLVRLTERMDFPIEDKYWYCCFTQDGYKFVVVFVFKPEMYKVFRRYNPRATKPMPMPIIKEDKADTDDSDKDNSDKDKSVKGKADKDKSAKVKADKDEAEDDE